MENNQELHQPKLEEIKPAEGKKEEEKKFKISISKKTAIIIIAVTVIIALGIYFRGLFFAAIVNGSPISRFAVIKQLESQTGKSTLDNMITEKLIDQEAKKKGIAVSGEEIDAQIKKVEEQIVAQGGTLADALSAQNMTMDYYRRQVELQKKLEKLLADKIAVTDEEANNYLTENKVTVPAGQEEAYKQRAKDQLQQEKLSTEAGALIESLKSQAKINYFVNY